MNSETGNLIHFGRSIVPKYENGQINPVYKGKRAKNKDCVDKIRRNRSELIGEMKKIIDLMLLIGNSAIDLSIYFACLECFEILKSNSCHKCRSLEV